ncbi:MAG: hypothetical protein ACKORJ_00650 [Bacteroidota bacterium]
MALLVDAAAGKADATVQPPPEVLLVSSKGITAVKAPPVKSAIEDRTVNGTSTNDCGVKVGR